MSVTINTKQGPKQYITVAERVAAVHESGKAFQVLESSPLQIGERVLWRVVVTVDDKQYIGTAEVHLSAAKNTPEGGAQFETAETSAIGRALGFANFGVIDSIASADEVVRSHPAPAPAPAKPAPKQDNPNAERLERLFQRGEATNMWTKRGEFLAYMSKVLAQPITRDNVHELDSSMLDVIEDAMLEPTPEQRGAA